MPLEEKVVLGVDTEQATRSLKELREKIKEAKEEMLNAEEGSAKYNDALKRAANGAFELREMNEQVKNSVGDLGEIINNSTKLLGGIASGFAAAQGALGLFGIESEDLQKTLVKVQAATALASGLQGLEGMGKTVSRLGLQLRQTGVGLAIITKATAVWNFVLSLNPVLLIVTGVLALGAAVYALTNYLSDNNEEQAEQNRLLNESINARKKYNDEVELELEIMKIRKKTVQEQIDYERKMILKRQGDLLAETQFNKEIYEEFDETQRERNDKNLKEVDENIARLDELKKLEIKNNEKLDQDRIDKEDNLKKESHEKNIENIKKRNEEVKKIRDEYNIKNLEDLKDLGGDIEDISDEMIKDMDNISQSANDQMIENENLRIESKIEAQTLYDDLNKTELEKLTDKYNTEKELLIKNGMDTVALEEEYSKAKIEIAEREKQAKLQQLANLGNALGQAAELAGKQTALGKTLAIAQTTIGTYVAAQETYKSLAAFGPVVAGLGAAVAVAAGLKNIQAINKVKVPGGGSSSSSISAPTISAPSIPQNITATRNQLTTSEVNLQNQPVEAYVVESKLTAKQELSRKRVEETTF